MNVDKYFMWIHYERLHNHNKSKHNKTVCIFLGIYCIWNNWQKMIIHPPQMHKHSDLNGPIEHMQPHIRVPTRYLPMQHVNDRDQIWGGETRNDPQGNPVMSQIKKNIAQHTTHNTISWTTIDNGYKETTEPAMLHVVLSSIMGLSLC